MTTTDTILLILDKYQATTAVIAAELHQPASVLQAFLEEAADQGLIQDQPIAGALTCWQITEAGRDQIKQTLSAKQLSAITKS